MMFPVNRPASELTATELMNLYDETKCRHFARSFADADNIQETLKELRAEIERRMKPCDKQHYNYYQGQGLSQLGQSQIAQQIAQSQLTPQGGNR